MHKVTVITPTTQDRDKYMPRIMEMYARQDYPEKEMIIVHEDTVFDEIDHLPHVGRPDIIHVFTSEKSIGGKLNFACEQASGNIILRMDTDDLYAPDWISKSVEALISENAALVGLSRAYFLNSVPEARVEDIYEWAYRGRVPYLAGATMCFWKDTWKNCNFLKVSAGEDHMFCAKLDPETIKAHDQDKNKFIAVIHGENAACHKGLILMRKTTDDEQEKIFDTGIDNNALGILLQEAGYSE